MIKFISRFKIVLIALVVALVITFYYSPLGMVNPDPACMKPTGQFGGLCPYGPSFTSFDYMINPIPNSTIDWPIPVITFVILFICFYGELKIALSIIKTKNKKKNFLPIIVKIVAFLTILFILLTIAYLNFSLTSGFFGF